ncbi:MAG: hypothetical protein E7022_03930 [Desulfovibrio desulfuricans]|nr:hypothetical protein [Desulfovibrio desulfuricans]
MTTWWRIEDARPEHIAAIAAAMRPADMREVWASHRHTPAQALTFSLQRSELAWTCIIDDMPAFMWGAARNGSLITYRGAPWLLGTSAISERRVILEFLRQCPAYVERMQARFPRLENYVHARNRLSVRWLRWLGFTVETAAPVVLHDEPFFVFWRER